MGGINHPAIDKLGLAVYNEGGRVEAPERRIYNNIIETENESSGHPERLG